MIKKTKKEGGLKMAKRLDYFLILLTILALALFVTGCKQTDNNDLDDNKLPIPSKTTDLEVSLYFSDDQAMYLIPEQRNITIKGETTDEKIITSIVEELIKGPENQTLIPTIPPESKLLGVKINNHLAEINFSEELKTKHWGGSTGELMTINSLVNSVTELENIEEVLLLIEGEVNESLIGHLYTKEPFARDERVIKK